MKNFKRFVFVFAVLVLLSGCGKDTSISKSTPEEIKDDAIISLLSNQVSSLEVLSKTKEIYTKGEGSVKDYTSEDKIRYGIELRIGESVLPVLNDEEINALKNKGITGVISYVDLSDVVNNINKTFEESVKDYYTIEGCPKYTYVEDEKRFYTQTECTIDDPTTIISKIDKITKEDNKYYVTVIAGLNDGNAIYGDFAKTKIVKNLTENEIYEMSETDDSQFTKFTYTFEKDGNGNYIFENIKITK